MGFKEEGGVQDDTKVVWQRGRGVGGGVSEESDDSGLTQAGFHANDQELCFVSV